MEIAKIGDRGAGRAHKGAEKITEGLLKDLSTASV